MKKSVHILLVVVFALLQCVAPLVHAHVNGEHVHAHAGVLSPALELHHSLASELSQASCYIEQHESPAISLAQEFQRNAQPALPSPSFIHTVNPPSAVVVNFPAPVASRVSSFLPYSRAHAQAPPTFA
jgi:hypothetical protein